MWVAVGVALVAGLSSLTPLNVTTTSIGMRNGISMTRTTARLKIPSNANLNAASYTLFCRDQTMRDPTGKTLGVELSLVTGSLNLWNGSWSHAPPPTIASDTGYLISAYSAAMGPTSLINGTVSYQSSATANSSAHIMETAFAVVPGEGVLETEYYSHDGPVTIEVSILGPMLLYSVTFAKVTAAAPTLSPGTGKSTVTETAGGSPYFDFDDYSYGTSKCAEPCSSGCAKGCKCSGFICVKDIDYVEK